MERWGILTIHGCSFHWATKTPFHIVITLNFLLFAIQEHISSRDISVDAPRLKFTIHIVSPCVRDSQVR